MSGPAGSTDTPLGAWMYEERVSAPRLAQALGVSVSCVRGWRTARAPLPLSMAERIGELFSVSPTLLRDETGPRAGMPYDWFLAQRMDAA